MSHEELTRSSTSRSHAYHPIAPTISSRSRCFLPILKTPLVVATVTATILLVLLIFLHSDMLVSEKANSANGLPSIPMATTNSIAADDALRINNLGLHIFSTLSSDRNALISPYSVYAALAMVSAGTTVGSLAEGEFQRVLPESKLFFEPRTTDASLKLKVANSAWITSSVEDLFKKEMESFGADVRSMPASAAVVNEWVSHSTGGEIPTIMDELPEPLVAIIVNAVFFKAKWRTTFEEAETTDMSFNGAEGHARMMLLRNEKFRYAEVAVGDGRSVQVVEIPYGNAEYAAVAVLPDEGNSLDTVISEMQNTGASLLDKWTNSLSDTRLDVLGVPRFKIEYGTRSLVASLRSLGLRTAFVSNAASPPFARLTPDPDAYLSDILHKVTLECTEDGTVASAASAAVIMTRSMPIPGPQMVLNRPFLFMIRDLATGVLLFLGKVDSPVDP